MTLRPHIDMTVSKSKSRMSQLYCLCQFLDVDSLIITYLQSFHPLLFGVWSFIVLQSSELLSLKIGFSSTSCWRNVLHHFLFIIRPSPGCCFLPYIICLMVRVEEFFSPFVHILPPTVLKNLLICLLPRILLGITVWLFLDFSSLWTDFLRSWSVSAIQAWDP